MAKKRIRIDLVDSDGTRCDIKLEGNLTREKILRVFEAMNMMDMEVDAAGNAVQPNAASEPLNTDSPGSKIWHVVDKYFPTGKFTSTGVLEKYEDEFNEPVKLSMISTYLSRFSAKGRLERVRTGREWTYQTTRIIQKH